MELKIGNKSVGEGHPAYVILEIARTYNNDLSVAEKLIKIAAEEGVDAIKIQTIIAKELMVKNKNTEDYVKMLETLERSEEQHKQLKECAERDGIEFLSTPEGLKGVDLLEKIGVNAYKVSSLNLVYHKLLRYIASKGKPVILSTGMGDWDEIEKAVEVIGKINDQLVLMHCSSTYPTKAENANLLNINELKKFGKIVGYSDHTIGTTAPVAAVSLGAKVIEKHFTLDRQQEGADHFVGVDPKMLARMMRGIRDVEKMLGSEERNLCDEEKEIRVAKRRKIISANGLSKGCVLNDEDLKGLQVKSEEGIDCKEIEKVIGKKLKRDVDSDHLRITMV